MMSMTSRGRENQSLRSADSANSQQQILGVASQHNCFQYPSDDPEDATTSWMNQLKTIWESWKKCDGVTKMLQEYFASAPNPYAATLQVMWSCADTHQSKQNSLSYAVMEEFSRWTANREADLKHFLTPHLKCEAFTLGTQHRYLALTKMVFSTYQLIYDKELFVEPIRELVSRRQYKEACQSAVLLELHKHFAVEDFIVPLVFQDKLSIAEEFLLGSPNHQKILVSFLDGLLGKRNTIAEAESIIERLNIHDVKISKLHHKPLGKLVARLTKTYDLPPEICPNLNRKRSAGALQFLIHKRYEENGLGLESWREMVREAVGDNEDLQLELVESVNSYADPHEALYWANAYGIPKHKHPYNVKMLQEEASCSKQQGAGAPIPTVNQEGESWDDALPQGQYHKLPLPQSSIFVVDTEEKFEQFLDYIKDVPIVGIDSEWKPFFGTKKNELALLQIASREKVHILDVCSLGLKYPNLWNKLGLTLFANEKIIKLGFGFYADMKMMKTSLPYLGGVTLSGAGYIDLAVLWRKLVQKHNFEFPYTDEDGNSGESLTCLVRLCLGKHLDKSDQFSNWERRPLRESQTLYAALDAYCLLEVHKVLKQCAFEQNIHFNEVCHEIMTNVKKTPKKTSKPLKKQLKEENPALEVVPSPHEKPTPASQFRVVCDNMLCGLGRLLRKCGVDTVILQNEYNHAMCVRIANQQNRMIITRGHVYILLYEHVPPGHCYDVVSDVLDEQLEEVLRYFNVFVTRQDVFSRCQMCNGGDFVVVTRDVMLRLADAFQHIARLHAKGGEFEWEEAERFPSESDGYSEERTAPTCKMQYQNLESGVIVDRCETRKGVTVKVDGVPKGILNQVQKFYVCEGCGKCYWDGTHYERLIGGKLQKIVIS